ncbi:MAG TPA: bis(5'-nucleosyl)-tetraphosphatase (symmetrical) YqeK [Anaerolineae bacterium]
MDDIDRYRLFLEHSLTPLRFQHSLGVMEVMGELAELYALDSRQARIAGLLHDAAKDRDLEYQYSLAAEAGMEFQYPCERLPLYLHGPVGAYLVAKELGITDGLILQAIAKHTYADSELDLKTLLPWCLRAADILAPTQEWPGMRKLKSVVYAGKLEESALLQIGWLIEYFQELNIPVHPTLTASFQSLSSKMNVRDSFFERW